MMEHWNEGKDEARNNKYLTWQAIEYFSDVLQQDVNNVNSRFNIMRMCVCMCVVRLKYCV